MDGQDFQIQLEQQRAQERLANINKRGDDDEEGDSGKRMGWGVFLGALGLTILQLAVDWATAGLAGGLISLLLYFMLRKYRGTMGNAKKWINRALIATSIPGLDLVPWDLVVIIWAFKSSRKHNPDNNE